MRITLVTPMLLMCVYILATISASAQIPSATYEPLQYGVLFGEPLYSGAATANDCAPTNSGPIAMFNNMNVLYVSSSNGSDAPGNGPVGHTPLKTGTGANAVVKPGQLVCFETGTYLPFYIDVGGTSYTNITRFEVVPGNTATVDLTCAYDPNPTADCPTLNAEIYAGILIASPNVISSNNTQSYIRYVLVSGFYVHGPDDMLSGVPNILTTAQGSSSGYYNAACITVLGNNYGNSYIPNTRSGGTYIPNEADHIYIVANTLEGCSGGGIGVGFADYVTVDGNVIYDTDWYGAYAGSAISLHATVDTNPSDVTSPYTYKNYVINNTVFNNAEYEPWVSTNPLKITDGEGIIIDTNMNSVAEVYGPSTTPCASPFVGAYCLPPYSGYTLVSNNQLWGNGAAAIESTLSENVDITFNSTFNNDVNGAESGRAEIQNYDSLNLNVRSNLIYTSGFDTSYQQIYDPYGQSISYISSKYPYIGVTNYIDNTGYSCAGSDISYPAGYPPNQSGSTGYPLEFVGSPSPYACAGGSSGEYATTYNTVYSNGGLAYPATTAYQIQNSVQYMGLIPDILGVQRPHPNQTVAAGAFNVPQ